MGMGSGQQASGMGGKGGPARPNPVQPQQPMQPPQAGMGGKGMGQQMPQQNQMQKPQAGMGGKGLGQQQFDPRTREMMQYMLQGQQAQQAQQPQQQMQPPATYETFQNAMQYGPVAGMGGGKGLATPQQIQQYREEDQLRQQPNSQQLLNDLRAQQQMQSQMQPPQVGMGLRGLGLGRFGGM